jgi:hypothetical protein
MSRKSLALRRAGKRLSKKLEADYIYGVSDLSNYGLLSDPAVFLTMSQQETMNVALRDSLKIIA